MKFLFADEVKNIYNKKNSYGLIVVLIDSHYLVEIYKNFKKELDKLTIDGKEMKGKDLFSTKTNKDVGQNINFMNSVLRLSSSKSGKTAKFKAYVNFSFFKENTNEYDMYKKCFSEIINKIEKNNNIKKSLLILELDNNESVKTNKKDFDFSIKSLLSKRGYYLHENSFLVNSSNDTIGILFADYIGYILASYFNLSKFNKDNIEEIKSLISKDTDKYTDKEKEKLKNYINNYKKIETTENLMKEVKKIIFV
jgi:hypothetical protein